MKSLSHHLSFDHRIPPPITTAESLGLTIAQFWRNRRDAGCQLLTDPPRSDVDPQIRLDTRESCGSLSSQPWCRMVLTTSGGHATLRNNLTS